MSLYIYGIISVFLVMRLQVFLSEFVREDGVLRRDEGFQRLADDGQWERGDLSSHASWWPRPDFATAFFLMFYSAIRAIDSGRFSCVSVFLMAGSGSL